MAIKVKVAVKFVVERVAMMKLPGAIDHSWALGIR